MRLLVHWHIFYPEQIPWFLEKLKSIRGVEWDLYVTGRREAMAQVVEFKSDAVFLETENAGYDIWPFIAFLKAVDFEKYTHVLKIHTKNSAPKLLQLNGILLPGYRWRNLLVEALLGSPRRFMKALSMSERGLVCQHLLLKKLSATAPTDNALLREEAGRIGLNFTGNRFAAGTMFISRMGPFEIFRDAPIDASLFRGESATHRSGSAAHVYERLLSLCHDRVCPVVTRPLESAWSAFIVWLVDLFKAAGRR